MARRTWTRSVGAAWREFWTFVIFVYVLASGKECTRGQRRLDALTGSKAPLRGYIAGVAACLVRNASQDDKSRYLRAGPIVDAVRALPLVTVRAVGHEVYEEDTSVLATGQNEPSWTLTLSVCRKDNVLIGIGLHSKILALAILSVQTDCANSLAVSASRLPRHVVGANEFPERDAPSYLARACQKNDSNGGSWSHLVLRSVSQDGVAARHRSRCGRSL